MNQFFQNKNQIIAWLGEHHISKYQIKKHDEYGYIVDSWDKINLSGAIKENFLPVKFGTTASFLCSFNSLASLKGCPDTVNGIFKCNDNPLTSLEHGPSIVIDYYNCEDCQLVSLKGAPKEIHGHFNCHSNHLTSLEFCPQFVGKNFTAYSNPINTLDFLPQKVKGKFDMDYTLIDKKIDSDIIKLHSLEALKAWLCQNALGQSLSDKSLFKNKIKL